MEEFFRLSLPLWIAAFLILLYPWQIWRTTRLRKLGAVPLTATLSRQIRRLEWGTAGLLVTAWGVVLLFAYLPSGYAWLLPLEGLDVPWINHAGMVMIRFAFFWIVVSQFKLERVFRKWLKKHHPDPVCYEAIRVQSGQLLCGGAVVLLVGLFVTISSLGMSVLALAGMLLYYRNFGWRLA